MQRKKKHSRELKEKRRDWSDQDYVQTSWRTSWAIQERCDMQGEGVIDQMKNICPLILITN